MDEVRSAGLVRGTGSVPSCSRGGGGVVPPNGQNGTTNMALKVYTDSLQMIRDMRTTLNDIAKQDADLARQTRRALTSITLDIAEGEGRRNGNARIRFQTAMGSANEVRACIETADALGYITADARIVDTLDRIARTLNRLH